MLAPPRHLHHFVSPRHLFSRATIDANASFPERLSVPPLAGFTVDCLTVFLSNRAIGGWEKTRAARRKCSRAAHNGNRPRQVLPPPKLAWALSEKTRGGVINQC